MHQGMHPPEWMGDGPFKRTPNRDKVDTMLDTYEEVKGAYQTFIQYYIRIPLSFVMIVLGFCFEFLICLPFNVIMFFDNLFRKKI